LDELGALRTNALIEAALKGLKTAPIEPLKDLKEEVKCSLAELYTGCT
jgi:hypothetical protein